MLLLYVYYIGEFFSLSQGEPVANETYLLYTYKYGYYNYIPQHRSNMRGLKWFDKPPVWVYGEIMYPNQKIEWNDRIIAKSQCKHILFDIDVNITDS